MQQIQVKEYSGIQNLQYTNARSFANGYAAVCIDYTYKDALYFNSNETCLVSTIENTVQLLHFMFE